MGSVSLRNSSPLISRFITAVPGWKKRRANEQQVAIAKSAEQLTMVGCVPNWNNVWNGVTLEARMVDLRRGAGGGRQARLGLWLAQTGVACAAWLSPARVDRSLVIGMSGGFISNTDHSERVSSSPLAASHQGKQAAGVECTEALQGSRSWRRASLSQRT